MPKQIVHPAETRKASPQRLRYARLASQITETRRAILDATGWSERTFYRRITQDERLTELEGRAIAAALNIPINEIEAWQKGWKEGRK